MCETASLPCMVCVATQEVADDELRKKVLTLIEEQHELRLKVYQECRARFANSQGGVVAGVCRLSGKILTLLNVSGNTEDSVDPQSLKGRLEKLNDSIPCLRSFFLQLPPESARKNIMIHGDHMQGVPLYGALLHGIAAIETDVHYHNDCLVIGHDEADLEFGISFEDLYLKPLQEIIKERPFLFSDETPLSIFVDFKLSQSQDSKLEADLFYSQLYALIEKYKDIFEHFDTSGKLQPGPVRLVITGDDRRVRHLAQHGLKDAYLFLDGRFEDEECPEELIMMRSVRYPLVGSWQTLEEAHLRSNKSTLPLRFWSVPGDNATKLQRSTTELWQAFKERNIFYNTDHPSRLIAFLNKH